MLPAAGAARYGGGVEEREGVAGGHPLGPRRGGRTQLTRSSRRGKPEGPGSCLAREDRARVDEGRDRAALLDGPNLARHPGAARAAPGEEPGRRFEFLAMMEAAGIESASAVPEDQFFQQLTIPQRGVRLECRGVIIWGATAVYGSGAPVGIGGSFFNEARMLP